jgi:hypothetical protein
MNYAYFEIGRIYKYTASIKKYTLSGEHVHSLTAVIYYRYEN